VPGWLDLELEPSARAAISVPHPITGRKSDHGCNRAGNDTLAAYYPMQAPMVRPIRMAISRPALCRHQRRLCLNKGGERVSVPAFASIAGAPGIDGKLTWTRPQQKAPSVANLNKMSRFTVIGYRWWRTFTHSSLLHPV